MINIAKILLNAPKKGQLALYSTVHGEVLFEDIDENGHIVCRKSMKSSVL